MIVGNLGPGIGGDRKQGGFSHIGEANQAHIRQQLQFQNHVPLLPLESALCEAGHLPGGRCIVGIAPAAPAALGNNKILTGGHIHNDLIGFRIPDHCSSGNLNNQRLSTLSAHIPALSVHACLSGILALVTKIQQRGQIVIDTQNHTAAVTAVAAVRTTGGNIFLPMEGHGTIAAPTTANRNSNLIYKHRIPPVLMEG